MRSFNCSGGTYHVPACGGGCGEERAAPDVHEDDIGDYMRDMAGVEPEGDAQNPDMEPMLDSPPSTLPEVEALAARGYKRINRHAPPEVQVQSKSYLKRRAIMDAAPKGAAPKEDYPLLDALRASLAQRGKAARDAGPIESERDLVLARVRIKELEEVLRTHEHIEREGCRFCDVLDAGFIGEGRPRSTWR